MHDTKHTVLFLSNTFKGMETIQAVHETGCYTLLLIEEALRDEAWQHEYIDEVFYTPDLTQFRDVIYTIAYLNRGRQIDFVVPLDEFEGELVGLLREHFRLPGMGATAIRAYRDKLAMREIARAAGIPVPDFIGIKNYDDLRAYLDAVQPPYVLKPRAEASAMGIRKTEDAEQVWRALDELGDLQSYYLLEKFVPGDVYHVDSIVYDDNVHFVSVQKYGAPPMSVYQGGGVFTSRILPHEGEESRVLVAANERVLRTLGMADGVRHTEFIRAHADGTIYFLESAARVGGANIADMIEHGTNVNLWKEWGRIIVANLRGVPYQLPALKHNYAGILMTLARQQHPDMSAYTEPEIVWRTMKDYHAGLIVESEDYERVEHLLAQYIERFAQDFMAVAPPMGTQRTGSN